MSQMQAIFIIFFCAFICVFAKNEIYKRHKVFSVKLDTEEQQNNIDVLKNPVVDFWRYPSLAHGIVGRVMVPPSHFDWFEEKLRLLNIEVKVHIEDVYEYLKEKEESEVSRIDDSRDFNFRRYYRYDEILDHLRGLETEYADSTKNSIKLVEQHNTYQDRPLVYLKLNAINEADDVTKPIIVIEAASIAREWITVPAAMNVIHKLLDEEYSTYLNNFEWIVIPVLNPDGYEYSHTNNRLWIRTRRISGIASILCPGVNINRNFDIQWGTEDSSSINCADTFAGTAAFSEPESRSVSDLLEEYGSRILMYISLQNKGGFISYPWNYEKAASGLFMQHHLVGLEMIKAVNANYTLGVSSIVFDRAAGTSVDYVRSIGVRYTYNIDIVQSEEGSVVIPEDSIADIVEDVWRAIAVAADNILY